MDTSETYIKMCVGAAEIQAQQDGSQGEFVYCEGIGYQEMDDRPLTPFVWLPRQDQLQEMVLGRVDKHDSCVSDLHGLFFAFRCFVQEDDADGWWSFRSDLVSFEQLWLAFVMKIMYGKEWSGTEWKIRS